MPTHEELLALCIACTGDEDEWGYEPESLPEPITDGGIYWSADYNGVAGMLFVDKSDISKRVFFPAAGNVGYVVGTSFYHGGTDGCYWFSSLYTDYLDYAYRMYFYFCSVQPSNSFRRSIGYPVRPFSE